MKKHFFLPILIVVAISSGCGITKIEPIQNVQEPNEQGQVPKEKMVTWCDVRTMSESHEKFHEGRLWISSESFSGMNHAPTIRHFCREYTEFFTLQMNGREKGTLVSKKSGKSFQFTSTNTEPEVKLIEEKSKTNKTQVWFTIDGKTFVYDEVTDTFKENTK